jgi:capsular polysaccharide transport system ATP-binding protein
MIEVRNLTKSYYYQGKKTTIFRDLNFRIQTGESVAILGGNGAGKSTLLRILGGIDLPDSGTIETDRSISWPVGLVGGFQGSLTGRENVTFVSRIYTEKRNVPEKVRYVEEFAELGIYFDRPFKTYSSGMRSRVTFGLSMAFDFDVYLIDEVTAAGDQRFREKSKQVLLERKQNAFYSMVVKLKNSLTLTRLWLCIRSGFWQHPPSGEWKVSLFFGMFIPQCQHSVFLINPLSRSCICLILKNSIRCTTCC